MPRALKAAKRRRRGPRRVLGLLRAAPLLVRRRGQQPLNAADPPKRKNAADRIKKGNVTPVFALGVHAASRDNSWRPAAHAGNKA
jgi:hypothetical protein